jgi:hypothetical protein
VVHLLSSALDLPADWLPTYEWKRISTKDIITGHEACIPQPAGACPAVHLQRPCIVRDGRRGRTPWYYAGATKSRRNHTVASNAPETPSEALHEYRTWLVVIKAHLRGLIL